MPELKQTDQVELFGGPFDGAVMYRQRIVGKIGDYFPILMRKGITRGTEKNTVVSCCVCAIYKLNGNRAEFVQVSVTPESK